MNLKVIFLVFLIIVTSLPLLIRESRASTPAGTITYSAGTDTISVVGANSTHPAEFLDLYNADVAGGWNQVTKLGNDQFLIDCKLEIGNGSATTYFTDTFKEITFASGAVAADAHLIRVKGYATFTLGYLLDADAKVGGRGCTINDLTDNNHRVITGDLYSHVYLYGSTFYGQANRQLALYLDDNKIYNCLSVRSVYPYSMNADINNFQTVESKYGIYSSGGNLSRLTILNAYSYGVMFGSGVNTNLTDPYVRNSGTTTVYCYNNALDNGFINADFDEWTFTYAGTSTGEVYRMITLNLYVLNGALTDFVEDANVTLSHDGSVFGSWLSNSTGQIPQQTITYGFYNSTGGNTMYGGTPWTLTITHPDWQTYTSVFYPYSKIEWSISMQDTTTENNNILLSGLFVGVLCFAGFIVYIKRGN